MAAIRSRPETLFQAITLAAVGGYLDAFTFLRFGVFANAQTGNVILVGVDAGARHWRSAALHLIPIFAFMLGVLVVETLARDEVRRSMRRPLRVALGGEIVALATVASLPDSAPDLLITVTVALVAAIQFSAFRTMADGPYANVLASGNIRTMVVAAHQAWTQRDEAARRQAGHLAIVLLAFLVAAILAAVIAIHAGNAALGVPAGLLVATFAHLVLDTRRVERAAAAQGESGV